LPSTYYNRMISYLGGGKLGDFIHGLIVCKYNFEILGEKADLYIANKGDIFETSLESTYKGLYPILIKQDWINSFNIYNKESIDVNLIKFRDSKLLYKTNWIELYFHEFLPNVVPPKEYSWIDLEIDGKYSNSLIVNRSNKWMSNVAISSYEEIFQNYDEIYFICYKEHLSQYDNFPLKNKCQLLIVDNLYDYFI